MTKLLSSQLNEQDTVDQWHCAGGSAGYLLTMF